MDIQTPIPVRNKRKELFCRLIRKEQLIVVVEQEDWLFRMLDDFLL